MGNTETNVKAVYTPDESLAAGTEIRIRASVTKDANTQEIAGDRPKSQIQSFVLNKAPLAVMRIEANGSVIPENGDVASGATVKFSAENSQD